MDLGLPGIDIAMRRNNRSRRFSLRVSSLNGKVVLSVPPYATVKEARAFVVAQEDWLRGALERVPRAKIVQAGASFPYQGAHLVLTPVAGRGVPRIVGSELVIPGGVDQLAAKLRAHLKAQARDRLVQASDRYAAMIGRKVAEVALRDTKSRWGSCSAQGRLMYSWRLIMAPPLVLDYVAAHEVAHLVEMNHSPAFWQVVERLFPHWQDQRAWLRRQGNDLQAWRF